MALTLHHRLHSLSSSTPSSPSHPHPPLHSLSLPTPTTTTTTTKLKFHCSSTKRTQPPQAQSTSTFDPKAGVAVYKPKSYEVLLTDATNSLAFALQDGKFRLEIDFPPLPSSISSYKAVGMSHVTHLFDAFAQGSWKHAAKMQEPTGRLLCAGIWDPFIAFRVGGGTISFGMADVSKLKMRTIYLYIPNIIGYLRVLMNCVGFALCFSHKGLFAGLYFVSFVLDGLDGWFARRFNQVSTFGAVLDMVTDRISTACLLVILSQVYSPGLIFLSLLALDIASHWMQMYSTFLSGKASHKDVKDSTSWLFRLYYGNRMFMAFCCVSCEVLYILLFLLAKSQSEDVINVLVSSGMQHLPLLLLEVLVLFGWGVKQAVNVIQLKTAADACVLYDINLKQKP